MNRRTVLSEEITVAFTAAGTVQSTLDLPASGWAIGLGMIVSSSDGTVTITAAPWADHDQSVIGTSYKFLATGASTATTNISVAATSTSLGYTGMVVPAGDQYGAAAPIIAVHGSQLTITAAGTATVVIGYTATEW
jgi:hypothetical protein